MNRSLTSASVYSDRVYLFISLPSMLYTVHGGLVGLLQLIRVTTRNIVGGGGSGRCECLNNRTTIAKQKKRMSNKMERKCE